MSPWIFTLRLEKTVKEFDPNNNEIWILCDIESGTPYNAAYLLSQKYQLKLIYGLNLALLLELSFRKDTITDLELKQLINDSQKTIGLRERKMSIMMYRVDGRMLHGQVIATFAKALSLDSYVVVNEEIATSPRSESIETGSTP